MREERTIRLVEIPIGGKDGFVWNRLHGEREAICESLLKEQTESRREFLQTRLCKVDDALDRLMSKVAIRPLNDRERNKNHPQITQKLSV